MVSTVFVDHFSGLSFLHNQMSTDADATTEAKRAFEREAKKCGVTVRHQHADNGMFSSKAFVNEAHTCGQTISFCAVNAHHQNGRAEKKIRDLQEKARSMMLHAAHRWPGAVTANLWPFALRMANDMQNDAPKSATEPSPIELFSQIDAAPRTRHAHTFGCPVYVLDQKLQSGKRTNKWSNRARVGACLGASPRHSRKVALILSLTTGNVSPQFHCKFDDLFETRRRSSGNPPIPSLWQAKAGFSKADSIAKDASFEPLGSIGHAPANEFERDVDTDRDQDTEEQQQQQLIDESAREPDIPEGERAQDEVARRQVIPETAPEGLRRSGRIRTRTRELQASIDQKQLKLTSLHVPWDVFHDESLALQDQMDDPIAFALAASSNPDTMHHHEAMAAPDRDEFYKAMNTEVKSLSLIHI